jgi:hypothetical protein
MPKLELIIPSEKYLASYLDALTRGWSPDNIRGAEAAAEEIVEIAQDPARFIAQRAMIERRKAVRLRCRMDQLSSGSPDFIDGCGIVNSVEV